MKEEIVTADQIVETLADHQRECGFDSEGEWDPMEVFSQEMT